jgi:hypothetical protein
MEHLSLPVLGAVFIASACAIWFAGNQLSRPGHPCAIDDNTRWGNRGRAMIGVGSVFYFLRLRGLPDSIAAPSSNTYIVLTVMLSTVLLGSHGIRGRGRPLGPNSALTSSLSEGFSWLLDPGHVASRNFVLVRREGAEDFSLLARRHFKEGVVERSARDKWSVKRLIGIMVVRPRRS